MCCLSPHLHLFHVLDCTLDDIHLSLAGSNAHCIHINQSRNDYLIRHFQCWFFGTTVACNVIALISMPLPLNKKLSANNHQHFPRQHPWHESSQVLIAAIIWIFSFILVFISSDQIHSYLIIDHSTSSPLIYSLVNQSPISWASNPGSSNPHHLIFISIAPNSIGPNVSKNWI